MINLHNLKLPLKKGFLPFSLTFQPHYFVSQGFDVAKDYYKILGVSQSATDKQIKAAYFSLAKKYHPDVNKGNADRFKEISDAYSIIGEANKRKDYDAARKYASSNSGFGSNRASQSQQSYGGTSNKGYSQYGQNSGYYNNNQQQQQAYSNYSGYNWQNSGYYEDPGSQRRYKYNSSNQRNPNKEADEAYFQSFAGMSFEDFMKRMKEDVNRRYPGSGYQSQSNSYNYNSSNTGSPHSNSSYHARQQTHNNQTEWRRQAEEAHRRKMEEDWRQFQEEERIRKQYEVINPP